NVSLPKEDSFDISSGIAGAELLDLQIVVGQHHYGYVEPGLLDPVRQLCRIHVTDIQVRNDQVEPRLPAGESFRAARHVSDSWDVFEVQFERFAYQEFIKAPVLAENKRIVET